MFATDGRRLSHGGHCNSRCRNFNEDISGWDTSSVTSLKVHAYSEPPDTSFLSHPLRVTPCLRTLTPRLSHNASRCRRAPFKMQPPSTSR
jgi:surface protein